MFSKLVVQLFLLFMPFLLLTGCEWKSEKRLVFSHTDGPNTYQTEYKIKINFSKTHTDNYDQTDVRDDDRIESRDSDRYTSVTSMKGILIKSNNGSTINYDNGRIYVEARDAYLKIDRDYIEVNCYGRCNGTVNGRNIKVRLDPNLNNVHVTGEGSKKTYF